MAIAEDEEQSNGLETLERSLKTNRRLLLGLLAAAAVIVSVLITSLVVVNIQLSNRRDVPAEEFAAELEALRAHLQHLEALHDSEAQVYFGFQDRLDELETLYTQEQINTLRQAMVEREQDHRQLLALMGEGAASLALMISGSRDWTADYKAEISGAQALSEQRELALIEAMKPPAEEPAETDAAPAVER